MTLIIGIEDPDYDRTILACDSGAWKHDQVDVLRTLKIWRSNGWIIGGSGAYRHVQWARLISPSEPMNSCSREDLEFFIIDWARKVLADIGSREAELRNVDPDEKHHAPVFVLAYGRWVFESHNGTAVNVQRGFSAIGCSDYALGAYEASTSFEAAKLARAEAVMWAVHRCTKMIEPPFRWMATDGTEGVWES